MCDKEIFVEFQSSLKLDEKLKIKVRIPNILGYVDNVTAFFNKYGETPGEDGIFSIKYDRSISTATESFFIAEISFKTTGYRTWFISLDINSRKKTIKFDERNNSSVLTDDNLSFFEVFVYDSTFETSKCIRGGIMYQIYVDTFYSKALNKKQKEKVVPWNTFPKWEPDSDGEYRNNQFYGGNIKGIIEKLPYIKSLGVSVIYLTSIFQSLTSHRYNITNHFKVDDLVGTWEDVDELKKEANSMGIKLVLDVVLNHSSNKNPLLKECPEMYEWVDGKPVCWWDYSDMPQFKQTSKKYLEFLYKALTEYYKHADGIRVDVADSLSDTTLKYLRRIFPKYILLEVWKNAITGDHRGFIEGNEGDGVMNYQFSNAICRYIRWGTYRNFQSVVGKISKLYPKEVLSASPIFLSSHDIPRVPNIMTGDFMKEESIFENIWDMEKDPYWFSNDGKFNTYKFRKWEVEHDKVEDEKMAYKLQALVVFLQYTLPGMPSIFAGDEAGVTGYKDPTNRKPFPWNNINKKIYDLYYNMGQMRNKFKDIFSEGSFKIISIDEKMIIYQRENLVFYVNRTSEYIPLDERNRNICFKIGDYVTNSCIGPYTAFIEHLCAQGDHF